MLDNRFDALVLGDGPLATLFSCILQTRGPKVLHIQDERIKLGQNFTSYIGELEKDFLVKCGLKENIGPMINIEKYLKPVPSYFYIGHKPIVFNQDVSKNIGELWRKFPQLFSSKLLQQLRHRSINESCKILADEIKYIVEKLPEMLFLSEKNKKKSFDLFSFIQKNAPHFFTFLKSIQPIRKNKEDINESTYTEEEQFIYTITAFYLGQFSDEVKGPSIVYLFLSLFLPRYQLDELALANDLKNVFYSLGGQGKKTEISDWQIYRNKPNSVLLKSFEGIIHSSSVFILGGPLEQLPFTLNKEYLRFSAVSLELELQNQNSGLPLCMKNESRGPWVISYKDKVGKQMPLLFGRELVDKNTSNSSSFLIYSPVIEDDLYSPYIRSCLQENLKIDFQKWSQMHGVALSKINLQWKDISRPFSFAGGPRDLFLSSHPQKLKNSQRPFELSGPQIGQKLKDVSYWGPEYFSQLGALSFLQGLYLGAIN